MGLKFSPDIAQAIMENVLSGIEDADVYIDDVGAFIKDWNHHIICYPPFYADCEKWLYHWPLKCKGAVKETDWLGHWLTPRGLKPWKKKIDAILHMDRPWNATELHVFIGCINYDCDMWQSHAHLLKPLTNQSGLKKCAPIK